MRKSALGAKWRSTKAWRVGDVENRAGNVYTIIYIYFFIYRVSGESLPEKGWGGPLCWTDAVRILIVVINLGGGGGETLPTAAAAAAAGVGRGRHAPRGPRWDNRRKYEYIMIILYYAYLWARLSVWFRLKMLKYEDIFLCIYVECNLSSTTAGRPGSVARGAGENRSNKENGKKKEKKKNSRRFVRGTQSNGDQRVIKRVRGALSPPDDDGTRTPPEP